MPVVGDPKRQGRQQNQQQVAFGRGPGRGGRRRLRRLKIRGKQRGDQERQRQQVDHADDREVHQEILAVGDLDAVKALGRAQEHDVGHGRGEDAEAGKDAAGSHGQGDAGAAPGAGPEPEPLPHAQEDGQHDQHPAHVGRYDESHQGRGKDDAPEEPPVGPADVGHRGGGDARAEAGGLDGGRDDQAAEHEPARGGIEAGENHVGRGAGNGHGQKEEDDRGQVLGHHRGSPQADAHHHHPGGRKDSRGQSGGRGRDGQRHPGGAGGERHQPVRSQGHSASGCRSGAWSAKAESRMQLS